MDEVTDEITVNFKTDGKGGLQLTLTGPMGLVCEQLDYNFAVEIADALDRQGLLDG